MAFKSPFFIKDDPNPNSQHKGLHNTYNSARGNILLIAIVSFVNILLLVNNGSTYFLFSASIPYILTDLGMLLCEMYPPEAYLEFDGFVPLEKPFFIIMLVISILVIAFYVLCYIFSNKRRVGWLIAALVAYALDTVVMLIYYEFHPEMIIEILLHGWIIVLLSLGIWAYCKMKKLPEDIPVEDTTTDKENTEGAASNESTGKIITNSTPLRPADTDEKARVLLEADAYGHKIIYRRIKRTNELVIDGSVYSEYIALLEYPHMLTANIDGHTFAAGFDATSHSFILVDGNTVKMKARRY